MLTMEQWATVRHLHDEGLTDSAIARRLGLARNTVVKYLNRTEAPSYTPRRVPSKLLPFTDYLSARVTQFPELSAWRLFREIQDQGYDGGYSLVQRWAKAFRPEKAIKAVYRYETPPGRVIQCDWAHFGHIDHDGEKRPLYAFIMTLGHSRAKYVEFTTDVTTPTFLECHQHAFDYFGGYAKEILYDNLKSVVLERALHATESKLNPVFLDFAAFYGFTPRLCAPYRPETKGKVENAVKVLRYGFFVGTPFSTLAELNQLVHRWCNEVNQRTHRTTGRAPIDLLEIEKLTPVEGRPHYPIVRIHHRLIQRDGLVRFQTNFYSVPWKFSGQPAILREENNGILSIEVRGVEICRHTQVGGSGQMVVTPGHREGLLGALRRQNQRLQLQLESFQSPPGAPDVEQRDLSVYDKISEGTT